MNELFTFPIKKALSEIKKQNISTIDFIAEFTQHVKNINQHINAVEQYSTEVITDKSNTLLKGLPISIKDAYYATHFKPSLASNVLLADESPYDMTLLKQLKQIGAHPLTMTNVPELLIGFETDNYLYGRTNNPHHLNYSAGGSSGGEAALIACGGSYLGIASDGAGSVRQPAHYCGVVAYKPTQCLLSNRGTFPLQSSGELFNHISSSLIARHVDDIILVLPYLIDQHEKDENIPPINYHSLINKNIKDIRIAIVLENDVDDTPAQQVNLLLSAMKECESSGAKVSIINFPFFKQSYEVFRSLMLNPGQAYAIKQLYNDQIQSRQLQQYLKLMCKNTIDVKERYHLLSTLNKKCLLALQSLENHDVILCPAALYNARVHGEFIHHLTDVSYLVAANILHCPSISVPCGLSNDHLPMAIQVLAKPWHDKICFTVSKLLENIFGGWIKPALINSHHHSEYL